MPRHAREKGEGCTYHIMIRSIKEVKLFADYKDKDKYLCIMKEYQKKYLFKVYSYCLMDNHAHFEIYADGADISKIMHGINFTYARYYNYRHGRYGHLFQDRFKSNIVSTEKYLLSLSGYIHNNPSKIGRDEKKYPYSSLGIYIGLFKDQFGLIDTEPILSYFGKDIILARRQYLRFVEQCSNEDDIYDTEFKNEATEYRSEKSIIIRNYSVDDITGYVAYKTGVKADALHMKHCHKAREIRAIFTFLLKCFCNMRCRDIGKILGNITESRVSKLCSVGLNLLYNDEKYNGMIYDFMEKYKAA